MLILKKAGLAILISDRADFKPTKASGIKKFIYVLIKGSVL